MNEIEKSLIEKHVVVRSSQSGVWMGHLLAVDGDRVALADARRAWSWEGAPSCSGLALQGPGGGRINAPVRTAIVMGCCEILECAPAAVERWIAVAPWVLA